MPFQITSLYACLLTVLVMVLGNIVSAKRGKTNTAILHGDDMDLAVWMRRHGNLAENAAIVLLMLALCEARHMAAWSLHTLGCVLIVSRLLHIAGLNATKVMSPLRLAGGIGTQLVQLGCVIFLGQSLF